MPEGSPKALYLSFYRTRPKIILHRPPSSFLLFVPVNVWSSSLEPEDNLRLGSGVWA